MKIEYPATSNVLNLEGGDDWITINKTSDTFVLLGGEININQLRWLFNEFQNDLRMSVLRGYSHSLTDFPLWRPEERETPQIGDGLKAFEPVKGTMRFQYVKPSPILQACFDLGLIAPLTVKGTPLMQAPRGSGGLTSIVAKLTPSRQLEVLTRAFELTPNLDDLIYLGQRGELSLGLVQKALNSAIDGVDALEALLPAVEDFCENQEAQHTDAPPREFGPPLFFAYLASKAILLWPNIEGHRKFLVPKILRPIWWEVLSPKSIAPLLKTLFCLQGDDRVTLSLRRLLLTSDFLQVSEFPLQRLRFLANLKVADQHFGEPKPRSEHELNVLARSIVTATGGSWEDIADIAPYLGGGKRINKPHATQAFDWITHPKKGKRLYTKVYGTAPPTVYSEKIRSWAAYLRDLLPSFPVQSLRSQKVALDYWLLYLIGLSEDECPPTFKEVTRAHFHNPLAESPTFVDFLVAHDTNNVQRNLTITSQAWLLASIAGNYQSLPNPIDPKRDLPNDLPKPVRAFHSHRRAMTEEQLRVLLNINSRDDYAFARSLCRYDKKVFSGDSVFWPAIPIIVHMMAAVGMRSSSAIWADSGEGDEYWPGNDGNFTNPLPIARKGRAAGVLQSFELEPGLNALGFNLIVNKTGAYSAPWIDPELIGPIRGMRDWQIQHNPRREPVVAVRDVTSPDTNPSFDYPLVYPLFRDPEDRSSRPPTWATVQSYWILLLKQTELEFNEGRPEVDKIAFFVDGAPRWDLHSLRVSFVTNAREAGISDETIRAITGHRTIVMTTYYDVRGPVRAHQELVKAKQAELDRLQARLMNAKVLLSQGQTLEDILGDVLMPTSGNHPGLEMLRWALENGAEFTVFQHGICPGAQCARGNGDAGRDKPVFRPMACSRCQFRVTGGYFHVGLGFRANALIMEVKMLLNKITKLNQERRLLEDQGKPTIAAEEAATRLQHVADEVFQEWIVERNLAELAERAANDYFRPNQSPALQAPSHRSTTETVHPIFLVQGLFESSMLFTGGSVVLPDGLQKVRDDLLFQIAEHNNMSPFLFTGDPETRDLTLHLLGRALTEVANSRAEPDEYIEELIQGSALLDPDLKIAEQVAAQIAILTGQQPRRLFSNGQ